MTRRVSPLGLPLAYGVVANASVHVTGAESAGEAGTATVTFELNVNVTGAAAAAQGGNSKVAPGHRIAKVGPLGLPLLYKSNTDNSITGAESAGEAGTVTIPNVSFVIVGASSPAQPGVVTPRVLGPVKGQLGPLILSGPRRDIAPKGNNNVSVNITGAAIQGQWSSPDLADATIYADGGSGSGDAGAPLGDADADAVVLVAGSAAAAEAGTATATELLEVAITGAEAAAESGQATGIGTITGNTDATLTGAQSAAEAGTAVSPDNAVTITGAGISSGVSSVAAPAGSPVFGAESLAEAGTVTASTDLSVDVSGAEIGADAGTAISSTVKDAAATPTGAASVAEAGTPTLVFDSIISISGAFINAQSSEVGLDFKTGVSPTITGAATDVLTSTVGFVNLYPIPVTGAEIQAQAYEVASGFGDIDLGLTNSTDRFNGLIAGLAVKAPCRTAVLTNITLSGHQFINGLSLVTGDRVLVTAQTNSVDNGIYVVDSSDWERAADFDGNRDIVRGTLITVTNE